MSTATKPHWFFPALAALFLALAPCARGDERIVVKLPRADREQMQNDMVRFMEQQHALIDALAVRDMTRVENVARQARPPLARIRALVSGKPLPPEGRLPQIKGDEALFLRMRKNLPPPYLNMLLGMRETWAKIENDASRGGSPEQALKHMSALQGFCVTCHKLYRIEPVADK
ncbi:MAG: hypothetical protein LBM17_09290 [Candidatus Accumulibacter sp.]|jgi:hypothetical protein|nr:hypothetical protein [Accumulibacter sp.]